MLYNYVTSTRDLLPFMLSIPQIGQSVVLHIRALGWRFHSRNLPNFDAKENGPSFLTSDIRTAFYYLRLAFIKVLILWHFYLKYHIWIEIDVIDYAIDSVLSQLTSETKPYGIVIKTDLGQWHLVAFFLKKMILVKTWYETHNNKLFAIIKVFKTWHYYLKGCKHKVIIFTHHNNFCCFMDMKSLSFGQVCWA